MRMMAMVVFVTFERTTDTHRSIHTVNAMWHQEDKEEIYGEKIAGREFDHHEHKETLG